MTQQSKLSGASDTVSDRSVFLWARLKLTGVYVIIVAAIVIGFSAFLYFNLQQSLNEGNGVDGDFSSNEAQQQFVDRTLTSFEHDLLLIDAVILVCTGALGFWFAGYTLRPIERALEAQQAFSEKASHELRTPLAVMRNDFEVLLRNPSPTKELMQTALRSNIEEIDHLTSMTSDLLTLARSHTDSPAPAEQIDLAEVARSTTEKLTALGDKNGVSITVSAVAPVAILGRSSDIARVLTNLVQNAIEHTPQGGSVVLEVRREGPQALMRVSDTGTGIDPKDLPHVFERFYKGEGTNGSGLGLSIVKEIIAQHGGEVSIESEKGKGTKVTMRLPLSA